MENAGAVFFRETLLLLDPATVSLAGAQARRRGHRARAGAHVVRRPRHHGVVGRPLAERGVRHLDGLPRGRRLEARVAHVAGLRARPRRRARASTRSPARTRSTRRCAAWREATENFDLITYEKGAAVVRMIEHYLGADAFRDGVRALHGAASRGQRGRRRPLAGARRGVGQRGGARGAGVDRAARLPARLDGARRRHGSASVRSASSPIRRCRPRSAASAGPCRWSCGPATDGDGRACWPTSRRRTWLCAPSGRRGATATRARAASIACGTTPGRWPRLRASLGSLTPVERLALAGDQWALVRAGARQRRELPRSRRRARRRVRTHDVLDGVAAAARRARRPGGGGHGLQEALRAVDRRALRPGARPARLDRGVARDGRRAAASRGAAAARRRRRRGARGAGRVAPPPRRLPARPRSRSSPTWPTRWWRWRPAFGDAALYDRYRAVASQARTPQEQRRFLLSLASFRTPREVRRTLDAILTPEVPTQDVAFLVIRLFANPAGREEAWRFLRRKWSSLRKRVPPLMLLAHGRGDAGVAHAAPRARGARVLPRPSRAGGGAGRPAGVGALPPERRATAADGQAAGGLAGAPERLSGRPIDEDERGSCEGLRNAPIPDVRLWAPSANVRFLQSRDVRFSVTVAGCPDPSR